MHIVIVDPSRVALKVISGLLTPNGHFVHAFTDSREALVFLADNEFVDALITSLEVQPIAGLELCWQARLLAETRRPLYIIAMSSLHNTRNLGEALDSGADDFISKPPSAEELHARLRAAQRLTGLQRELIRLAETDPLTGLLNRRAFTTRSREATERLGPHSPLSLVLVDIDHFKAVNDTHGHDVGDLAIQAVAAELAKVGGIAGRLGGEEFGVLLPGQSAIHATEVANALRLRCQALLIKGHRGPVRLTCSFGISEWSDGETVEGLLKRADIALYDAKAAGRNSVVTSRTDFVLAKTA
ncbi:GGDEF domain-containing protein [Salinarimonas soli]|uniref:diguanylate cyclase n=1 Tax=Salinarimonas soli TaxID=1638099 RepID=A0A5B2VCN4_9HYPH|nr:diguanylate cyclase [Salinarimonas soli]KAA2236518.1 diguanylate cyclase [Salinarimonas soli]